MNAEVKNENQSYTNLRRDIVRHVTGKNKTLLDVGCATGENGKYLIDKGVVINAFGIELDKAMAEKAMEYYNEVTICDLDYIDVNKLYAEIHFDYILLGDILEHLKDPWVTLKKFKAKLKRDGKIIISLPNVQHIDVLINIFIRGYWPYNDRGIFDKTHLRFFTYRNMVELITSSDLKIESVHRNFRRRDWIGSEFGRFSLERLLKKRFKDLYTHQFVFVCASDEK